MTAVTGFGLDPDLAPHHFHQTPTDGQTQARAAEFPCGAPVRLTEGLEQVPGLLWRHADAGVFDIDGQADTPIRGFANGDIQSDVARFSELDGIVDQIDQNLPQAQRIAHQVVGHVRSHVNQELQSLFMGLESHHGHHIAEHVIQPERYVLDDQLVRLDFREIENIVDDAEQRGPRAVDFGDIVALLGRQIGFQAKMRQADDGIHGGPDFMAHIGQEHALGLGRRLGLFPGGLHLGGFGADFGVGLKQSLLLLEQFLLGDLQFLGLLSQHFGLPLGFLQQLARALVALEDFEIHGQRGQEAVDQFAFARVEGLQAGQFDHRQQALVGRQDRGGHYGAGGRFAQTRSDADVIGRDIENLDGGPFEPALSHQALAESEYRGQALALAVAIAAHEAEFVGGFVKVEEHADLSADHGRQSGHHHPGKIRDGLLALQRRGDLGKLRFDPGGPGLRLGGQLQSRQGLGHGANLVLAALARQGGFQFAGGDTTHGAREGMNGPQNRTAQHQGYRTYHQ